MAPDAATAEILTGAGTGSQSNVPGSNVLATFEPTATSQSGLPPTATPPPITADEEVTSVLVDNLSADEFPRTAARTLEAIFREEPARVASLIGKSYVIQGDVRDSGRDAAGSAFVTYGAGAGAVTCMFERISEAELRRLTPGGRNSVTGKIASWDAASRLLIVQGCRLVRGY